MPCQFLLYKEVNQLYVYIYPLPVGPPSLHPTPLGHHRSPSWTPCAIQQLPTSYLFYPQSAEERERGVHGLISLFSCNWGRNKKWTNGEHYDRRVCLMESLFNAFVMMIHEKGSIWNAAVVWSQLSSSPQQNFCSENRLKRNVWICFQWLLLGMGEVLYANTVCCHESVILVESRVPCVVLEWPFRLVWTAKVWLCDGHGLPWKENRLSASKSLVSVTQLCLTLCDPMDCSLPGSSVHGIFQARILEWVAISYSRGSSQPRDWTRVSCTACRLFTFWTTKVKWKSLSRVRLFVIPWTILSMEFFRPEYWSG